MILNLPRRAGASLLVVGLVSVAGLVVTQAPAAAVTGLVRVSVQSVEDFSLTRSVRVTCPDGKVAIDGGALITGAKADEVRLTGLRAWGSSFRAQAAVRDNGGGLIAVPQWGMSVTAICASESVGVTHHRKSSRPSTDPGQFDLIQCPAGQLLIGLGAEVHNSAGQPARGVALHQLVPAADLTSMFAQAFTVDATYTDSWSMSVYATCIGAVLGLQRVTGQSGPTGLATASCPSGTELHGIGGGHGVGQGQLALYGMFPFSATGMMVLGWSTSDNAPNDWVTTPYAICAA
jgi:hypothetical protein